MWTGLQEAASSLNSFFNQERVPCASARTGNHSKCHHATESPAETFFRHKYNTRNNKPIKLNPELGASTQAHSAPACDDSSESHAQLCPVFSSDGEVEDFLKLLNQSAPSVQEATDTCDGLAQLRAFPQQILHAPLPPVESLPTQHPNTHGFQHLPFPQQTLHQIAPQIGQTLETQERQTAFDAVPGENPVGKAFLRIDFGDDPIVQALLVNTPGIDLNEPRLTNRCRLMPYMPSRPAAEMAEFHTQHELIMRGIISRLRDAISRRLGNPRWASAGGTPDPRISVVETFLYLKAISLLRKLFPGEEKHFVGLDGSNRQQTQLMVLHRLLQRLDLTVRPSGPVNLKDSSNAWYLAALKWQREIHEAWIDELNGVKKRKHDDNDDESDEDGPRKGRKVGGSVKRARRPAGRPPGSLNKTTIAARAKEAAEAKAKDSEKKEEKGDALPEPTDEQVRLAKASAARYAQKEAMQAMERFTQTERLSQLTDGHAPGSSVSPPDQHMLPVRAPSIIHVMPSGLKIYSDPRQSLRVSQPTFPIQQEPQPLATDTADSFRLTQFAPHPLFPEPSSDSCYQINPDIPSNLPHQTQPAPNFDLSLPPPPPQEASGMDDDDNTIIDNFVDNLVDLDFLDSKNFSQDLDFSDPGQAKRHEEPSQDIDLAFMAPAHFDPIDFTNDFDFSTFGQTNANSITEEPTPMLPELEGGDFTSFVDSDGPCLPPQNFNRAMIGTRE